MYDTNSIKELLSALSLCNTADSIYFPEIETRFNPMNFDKEYVFNTIRVQRINNPEGIGIYKLYKEVQEALERCELSSYVTEVFDRYRTNYHIDQGYDVIIIPKAEYVTSNNLRINIIFLKPIQIKSGYDFIDSDPILYLRNNCNFSHVEEINPILKDDPFYLTRDHRDRSFLFTKDSKWTTGY